VLGPLGELEGVSLVFTAPHPDPGHLTISDAMRKFVEGKDNAVFVESMGHRAYLSLMLCSTAVVGNSSSGVLEAPVAGVPSLNIGDRQDGRVMASSVLLCEAEPSVVQAALRSLLASKNHVLTNKLPVFNGPETVSAKIVQTLRQINLSEVKKKIFNDIDRR
jgi:UDP-N-acetylglucosamine 2-epimerase